MSLKKISVLVVSMLFGLSVLSPIAFAQGDGGNGLQLSPTRTDLTAQAGEQKTVEIVVKNITQGDLTAKGVVNDFESDNVGGTPKIIVDENQATPYSIKKMISGLDDFDLKSGESKTVKLTLNVPENSAPGAYFGAVRYIASPKGQSTSPDSVQVSLTASVAHLVFLEIPGEINEQIKLEALDIKTFNGKSGSILFSPPATSDLTIKNLGNGFSKPFGNVTIFNSSNKEVFKYEVNKLDPKGIVLPNSKRTFTDSVEKIKTPGKYKAIASVAYGNGGEVVNYEKSFWYLPFWFIGVLIAIVLVLVGGGFFGYKKVIAPKMGR